jgi:UDP-galactopyranose mutase
VSGLAPFEPYVHKVEACFRGELYDLPFNMNTFSKLWGVTAAMDAEAIIAAQRGAAAENPRNLEQQALRLVGRDIYEKFIKVSVVQ